MTQPPTRKCWSCKQRRLKCDGGLPHCLKCWSHGIECLGYKKPLVWVEGVARRGPMKNRTFGDAQGSSSQGPTSVISEGQRHQRQQLTKASKGIPMPVAFVEPLFTDLSYTSRFLIDYFSKCICPTLVLQDQSNNPYRNVIRWINTPTVASAIMTVSSCHYIQHVTNCPMTDLLPPAKNRATLMAPSKSLSGNSNAHTGSLVKYYLRSKSHCLGLVSAALAIHGAPQDQQSLLIAVVLLALLDMFESGSGAWVYHIEGIKKMLEVGTITSTSSWDDNLQNLLYEAATLQIFGSSLAKPGALTSASTLSPLRTSAFSTVTPIGCPGEILSTIEIFASQRRHDFVFAQDATNIAVLEGALHRMRSYDIVSWAINNTKEVSKVSSEDLVRLGTIWQLSADIYACRVLSGALGCNLPSESSKVQDLIAEYAFLERVDDQLIKCLIWPTFIAGAASTTPEARSWVLKTLDRIWNTGHCANTKNAAKVLGKLWARYDQMNLSASHIFNASQAVEPSSMGHFAWDWLKELSSLEGSWLFV